jgi:ferric-dicitrate binding protein FerR (iron transport regulator)
MDNERYHCLITKSITGEITSEERKELDILLSESPSLQERYRLIEKFWKQEVFYHQSSDPDEALQKILDKINKDKSISKSKHLFFPRLKQLAAAAVIILMIGIGIFSYQHFFLQNPVALIEKYNGTGTRSMLTLSDGTQIWLNADSKISYPKIFHSESREVYLKGEAFFKVASDTAKPFYIHLSNASIKVLGTSFNVKAYSNEERIQTSVVSGKVAFMPRVPNSSVYADTLLLTKSNKVTYAIPSGEILTETTNTLDDKEWINGRLIYKSETLETISKELERNFGKKVSIKNPKLAQHRFTATFDEPSLNEIMYYLSLTNQFKYSITDSTLVIY